jgi:hypothetical protein
VRLIEIVALVLAFVVLLVGVIVLRRRFLLRGGGAVEMSIRLRASRRGRGWAFGIGRYGGDQLRWYRVFTLSPRPARILPRGMLEVASQRHPDAEETWSVQPDAIIIDCRYRGEEPGDDDLAQGVEIAMNSEAVTGFLSWLESSPPGYAFPPGQVAS